MALPGNLTTSGRIFVAPPNNTYRFRVHLKNARSLENDDTTMSALIFKLIILLFIRGICKYLKGPVDMLTLYENKYKQEEQKFTTNKLVEDEEMTTLMALFVYQ